MHRFLIFASRLQERKLKGTKVVCGAKVPRVQKFLEHSLLRSECSTGAKVLSMVFSLPGTKVQRNEKASYLINDLVLIWSFFPLICAMLSDAHTVLVALQF